MNTQRRLAEALLLSALLSGPGAAEIVISEIMYNPADAPDGSDGDPFEFLELYNSGAAPETLTSISDGITYKFTNAVPTVLNPGEYLVIAKDRAAFLSRYPDVTNLAPGAFSGKLSNDGEKITVKASQTANSVTYGTAGAWPAAANAFGPSLERYCMTASGNSSANWAASGSPAGWQQVAWTGRFDTASVTLAFFLDFDGKCLLDDVSLQAVGSSDELVTNGTFESGMDGWSAAATNNSHALSRAEPGLGRGGGAALALQCNESRWYVDEPVYSVTFYGDGASNCVASAPIAVATGQSYAVSWWVRRSGHSNRDGYAGKVRCVFGGVTNAVTLGSLGTPGRANSVGLSYLPLGVTNVSQAFTVCATGIANVVRARVSAPAEASSVAVRYLIVGPDEYRYTSGAYSDLAMRDDGADPDDVAGDGSYAAALPAVTSNWRLVRYHVVAAASNGFEARSPRVDDPGADYAYWVESSSPQTNLPNWHMLVDGSPILYPVSRHLCAVSPEGQIFTDIVAKHRGDPPGSTPQNTGIGLHFHRSKRYSGWFASDLKGINFRSRLNNLNYNYRRLVNEQLSYDLQRTIGLATPRTRFACAWINGFPSITVELEAPDEPFLTGNGLSLSDYLSRQSHSDGIEYVAGDEALNNLEAVCSGLGSLASASRNEFVRTNLCLESIQHGLALLALTADPDQYFVWNMMQHRSASDGRWRQYPWDSDRGFDLAFTNNGITLTEFHPYYQTPLHPSPWSTNSYNPLGETLFYPEGEEATTLPYRYRHQATLWRYCHTLFTTNHLYPKLDAIQSTLTPPFYQIGAYRSPSLSLGILSNLVSNVKTFIVKRRDFLLSGSWSDKMPAIWGSPAGYAPSNVVISEIMHTPATGGKYIELFNRGQQPADLSHWSLRAGAASFALPFGAMLGPTSFVVLTASQLSLTNAYAELASPARMIERYPKTGLWDWPIVFTSACEYASRVIEVAGFAIPASGGTLELRDVASNVSDRVTYANTPPWPDGLGKALERISPDATNTDASAWRACAIVGTPGALNAATADADDDTLPDAWEQAVVAASGGAFTNVSQVAGGDDFDGDGLSNGAEFILGTDPVVPDAELAAVQISIGGGQVLVTVPTIPISGSAYEPYSGRFYTLSSTTNLTGAGWDAIPSCAGRAAGGSITFTNAAQQLFEAFRFNAELRPIRP